MLSADWHRAELSQSAELPVGMERDPDVRIRENRWRCRLDFLPHSFRNKQSEEI